MENEANSNNYLAGSSAEDPYTYRWLSNKEVLQNEALMEEMVALYNRHYGIWSTLEPRGKQGRVCLNQGMLARLFSSDKIRLAYASHKGCVIGYAVVLQYEAPDFGIISWLTQLVVHSNHRNRGVSKKLIFTMWGFTNHTAWGVLTANPYAVRALESTTYRRCDPQVIYKHKKQLAAIGVEHISYMNENMDVVVASAKSKINTNFFVGHSEIPKMLDDVISSDVPWTLGLLDEGWEWFAFTFNSQIPMTFDPEDLDALLNASNQVAEDAYSRMLLDENHVWAKHTPHEVDFVIKTCGLSPGSNVLDMGCGVGRHALELARKGMNVIGIDYLGNLVSRAKNAAKQEGLKNIDFATGDCRDYVLGSQFDALICLYDVVGSFAEQHDNLKILTTIKKNLKPGCHALISVMNYELTEKNAKHKFTLRENSQKLNLLTPSHTMEKSVNIFDPNYYLVDTETRIIYRREQFEAGSSIPVELTVRDKRYTREEITELCKTAGLSVEWVRPVKLGDWNSPLEVDDKNAKEILVYCRRIE